MLRPVRGISVAAGAHATRPALLALLGVAVLAGCDPDRLVFEGTPGTPTPTSYAGLVPVVEVRIDDGPPRPFLVDTGAPFTVLDTTAFAREDGTPSVELEAYGIRVRDYEVVAFDVFDAATGADGILGGDLFRHFALSLDYRGGTSWLWTEFTPELIPAELELEPDVAIPVEVLGGGLAQAPGDCGLLGCGTIDLPPTRVIVRARFEALPEPVWALVDSGASAVVLSEDLHARLEEATPGRPRLDGVTVATVEGPVEAFFTRVYRTALGGEGEPSRAVDDLPVLVLPGTALLDGASAEVGRRVDALIGGTLLRHHVTTFDYPARALHLQRYRDQAHVPADEFIGVGFLLEPRGGRWVVGDLFLGTDAAAEGLAVGDEVLAIGGESLVGASPARVASLLGAYGLGEEVPLTVARAGVVRDVAVLVEDLLPSFPAP